MTRSDTLADFVVLPFILIWKEFLEEFLVLTVVVTPLASETPAPQEPFFRGSSGLSCIRKMPVMCPGENAADSPISQSHVL